MLVPFSYFASFSFVLFLFKNDSYSFFIKLFNLFLLLNLSLGNIDDIFNEKLSSPKLLSSIIFCSNRLESLNLSFSLSNSSVL